MLLINRDIIIFFFCNFFIRIKIPQLCKKLPYTPLWKGTESRRLTPPDFS